MAVHDFKERLERKTLKKDWKESLAQNPGQPSSGAFF
jgi:hypothetical protein